MSQGGAQSHWPAEEAIVVVGCVTVASVTLVGRGRDNGATSSLKLSGQVKEYCVGRVALFKSGGVDEWFKRRTGLAMSERDVEIAVILNFVIVARANHHQDLSCVRVFGHYTHVLGVVVFLVDGGKLAYDLFGLLLFFPIEGGNDLQTSAREQLLAVLLFERAKHVEDEVRCFDGEVVLGQKCHTFFFGRFHLLSRGEAELLHAREH